MLNILTDRFCYTITRRNIKRFVRMIEGNHTQVAMVIFIHNTRSYIDSDVVPIQNEMQFDRNILPKVLSLNLVLLILSLHLVSLRHMHFLSLNQQLLVISLLVIEHSLSVLHIVGLQHFPMT